MALERVTFSKSRGVNAPRISKPPLSEEDHNRRFWTEEELAVLRTHYVQDGPAACKARIPHRPIGSIYRKANELGLIVGRGRGSYEGARNRYHKTAEVDAKIRMRWPELKGRGAVLAFAEELGLPRWWVSRRARDLGAADVPYKKEPEWTAAELKLLERAPLHDGEQSARLFRQHGFNRTPTAIIVKAKRRDLSRRYTETLSARKVAEILGVNSKYATALCFDGSLKATRRPTKRGPQQGGDPWSVTRADLRAYILEHIDRIDIRKVEKFSFVQLMTEGAEPAPAELADGLNLANSLNGTKSADDYRSGQVAMRDRISFMVSPAMRSTIRNLQPEEKP